MPRRQKPSGKKTEFGAPRTIAALGRKSGKQPPQKTMVIVCEGEKTEPLYFSSLRREYRLHAIRVIPGKREGASLKVVERAVERQGKDVDEVWCVFDKEGKGDNPSFDKAVRVARQHGIQLAISNPAFEYWYLLHFECTDRPFRNADEVVAALKSYIPRYDKSMAAFPQLRDRTDDAISNAQRLRERASEAWDSYPNPSTRVADLVNELRQMKSEH